jgi:hypothetical protein
MHRRANRPPRDNAELPDSLNDIHTLSGWKKFLLDGLYGSRESQPSAAPPGECRGSSPPRGEHR